MTVRPLHDNSRFVSGSTDRQVFVWDVATGKTVQRYADHSQRVNSVAFNKDATVVASASYDSTIKIWDCRSLSKRPMQTLTEAKDSVESVFFNDYQVISSYVCSPLTHLAASMAASGSMTSGLARSSRTALQGP